MSLASVRAFFAQHAPEIEILETEGSSATVTLAAEAFGVEPARIAKTLSLRLGERVVLLVTRGDARLDNKKTKAAFGTYRARQTTPSAVDPAGPSARSWAY